MILMRNGFLIKHVTHAMDSQTEVGRSLHQKDNKLQKSTWDEAISLLASKFKTINPNKIGGHIGDMVNFENALKF